jgi:hypothetical protein
MFRLPMMTELQRPYTVLPSAQQRQVKLAIMRSNFIFPLICGMKYNWETKYSVASAQMPDKV